MSETSDRFLVCARSHADAADWAAGQNLSADYWVYAESPESVKRLSDLRVVVLDRVFEHPQALAIYETVLVKTIQGDFRP